MKDFSSSKTRIAGTLCKHLHSLMISSRHCFP